MSENLKQFIEDRQKKGIKAYEGLDEFGAWDGWYKTLTSLYPDNAHFVFELLQNAEDAYATKVKFELIDGSLSFKHNGSRDFEESDVYSITNVGVSKKQEETNQIGKFGVGFKSVFAYTTTPEIYSKTIDFKIEHLFIPSLIDTKPIEEGYTTLFIFPFDRDDKSKVDAFSEVKKLFDELSDNVLLFLTNIQTIKWQIANSKTHQITKEESNEFIEINNTQKGKSQWLVFDKGFKYEEIDKPLTLSIAFKFNKDENKIEPIRGDVSIFFPAKKETSKLKFHIDAPFASTVARDSIIESTENEEIIADIATLCRESIHKIKDQGLLSTSFFEVLPNMGDELDEFYQPIFDSFVDEFNSRENKLIPLYDGSFGSIDRSVYCPRRLSDIFVDEDDIYILFNNEELDGFAITARTGSGFEKFLSSLDGVVEYEDYDVFNSIYEIASKVSNAFIKERKEDLANFDLRDDLDQLNFAKRRRKWLETKSNEYLQSLYAFLYDTIEQYSKPFGVSLEGRHSNYSELIHLIKLSNGNYNYGRLKSFFMDESSKSKRDFTFVNPEVFSSGKSNNQQQKSKAFLEKIGVEDVDESTHIEYLFYNYKFVSQKEHIKDINKLVSWYIKEQTSNPNYEVDLLKIDLDKETFIYSENTGLVRANQTYIDEPYQSTGLRYIGIVNENHAIHPVYQKLENTPVFIDILTRLGSVNSLKISRSIIDYNQDWKRLWRDSEGIVKTHTGMSEDWDIEGLSEMLELDENRFEISRLIWNTVSSQVTHNQLLAKFQMSQKYKPVTAKSQLIFNLMAYEWIPDKKGDFYRPCDISEDMLPMDFVINKDNDWLYAVEFGKNIVSQQAEYQEKKSILAEYGIPIEFAEEMKREGLSFTDLKEAAQIMKNQKVSVSMKSNTGDGKTPEVAQPQDIGSIITDPLKHQENIGIENKGVSGKKTEGIRKVSRQDPEQLKKIDNFLYNEYNGHCQICGDTFKGNKERNIFVTHSLNRSEKGARLMSDVNRKGNSISLCPKHHLIFSLGLQSFSFIEKLDHSELSLTSIEESFDFRDNVGKGEVNEYDGFYNRPEESNFERDVFMLPITVFSKRFYLKFTQDHIQQFIEVWKNN